MKNFFRLFIEITHAYKGSALELEKNTTRVFND